MYQPTPWMYVTSLPEGTTRPRGAWIDVSKYCSLNELERGVASALGANAPWSVLHYTGMPFLGHTPEPDALEDYLLAARATCQLDALNKWVGAGHPAREFGKHYYGAFENRLDFAAEHLRERGLLEQVPEILRPYLDYENIAADLLQRDYLEISGHYFVRQASGGDRS